jgi:hypothetical protein
MGFIAAAPLVGGLLGRAVGGITKGLSANDGYNANGASLDKSNYADAITGATNLQPNMNLVNNTQSNQINAQQTAANASLADTAQHGSALAQAQLQQATDANTQQAAGTVASQKGINPALAARLAMENQASAQQASAGQSAVLQGQTQATAQGQLATALAAQRSQDLAQSSNDTQAGLGQLNAQTSRLATAGQLQNAQNDTSVRDSLGTQGINAGVAQTNTAGQNAITGGLISGGAGAAAHAMAARGGTVPGNAQVAGDSTANDKVPYMLSPGEIVVPRSAASSPDKAKEFIAALKKAGSAGSTTSRNADYSKVLESQRLMHERLARMESLMKGSK